ncbi:MAG: hypothetical protein K2G10_03305, partial [Alistipes sp.]|nr:hypothetical protein [Alistipes sp.]
DGISGGIFRCRLSVAATPALTERSDVIAQTLAESIRTGVFFIRRACASSAIFDSRRDAGTHRAERR